MQLCISHCPWRMGMPCVEVTLRAHASDGILEGVKRNSKVWRLREHLQDQKPSASRKYHTACLILDKYSDTPTEWPPPQPPFLQLSQVWCMGENICTIYSILGISLHIGFYILSSVHTAKDWILSSVKHLRCCCHFSGIHFKHMYTYSSGFFEMIFRNCSCSSLWTFFKS